MKKYDKNGGCEVCSGQYYKRGGVCTRISPLCKTYSTSSGYCLSCYPGYYLAGGACWAGNDPNLDPNCNLRSLSGSCLQCVPRYYLSRNGHCKPVNPLCKTFDIANGACLSCYKGYVIKGDTCALASSGVTYPNCLRFDSQGKCKKCYTSFYVYGGVCKQINPLCKSANTTDGTCLTCYPGYSLSKGNCVIPNIYYQQTQDPYCVTFDSQKCVVCRKGYYVQNGYCATVDPQCQHFDYAASRCISCYRGYVLSAYGCNL